jgi:poly-beta-1,6-N-acetyl-D-glucosamine synthase
MGWPRQHTTLSGNSIQVGKVRSTGTVAALLRTGFGVADVRHDEGIFTPLNFISLMGATGNAAGTGSAERGPAFAHPAGGRVKCLAASTGRRGRPDPRTRTSIFLSLNTFAGISLLILFLTWIGYPVAVWALGRVIRVRPAVPWPAGPTVSVVLASREPYGAVRARIENLLDSTYDPLRLEVIVALDRAREPDDLLLGEWDDRVRIVTSPGVGKAAAVNVAVAQARGDLIVFADTYQRFDSDAIPVLVAALADPRVGAVSGCLYLPGSRAALSHLYWTYERWLRRCEARFHSTVGATGAIYAMRRDLWQPLPEGLLCDDLYTPMGVVLGGHRVQFAEAARATELRVAAPRQEYRRKVRTLTGVIQVCVWLPRVLSPFHNAVWMQFVMHKMARLATPYALAVMAIWGATRVAPLLFPHRLPLIAAALAVGLWAALGTGRGARRTRDVIVEGALLQLAVIMAGINGLRGRWEVWHG